jgi:thiamine biosynthesis protein ThiC
MLGQFQYTDRQGIVWRDGFCIACDDHTAYRLTHNTEEDYTAWVCEMCDTEEDY